MDDGTMTAEEKLREALKGLHSKIVWGNPGPARFDFRSDVITTPSLQMLIAIIKTSLRDDVFREDETTISFELDVARMTGMEAGCFVITGTMANQLALRALLTQPPYAIMCSEKAHILGYEAGGPASMSGAIVQAVAPRNGKYLTLEDIESHAVITDDVHKCPTRVVSLENTASGSILSVEELRSISRWAKANDVKIHLDGARLWEAIAAGAGTLQDYCELVDTVAVDFSKNLGAPMGAMVLGKAELVHQIRRIRKSVGGGMRQAGVISSAARAALVENFGVGAEEGSKLRKVHQMAVKVGELWEARGGRLLQIVETNQVWVDLVAAGLTARDFNRTGAEHNILLDGSRIVLHHQIDEEALSRLSAVFDSSIRSKAHL